MPINMDQMSMLREILAAREQQGENQAPGPLPMEQGGGRPFAPEDITGIQTPNTSGDQEAAMEAVGNVIQQLLATIQTMPPWASFLNEALAVIHKGLGLASKNALKSKSISPAITPGMMGANMMPQGNSNSGMGQMM